MTNEERIIETLRANGALDDDDLSSRSGVAPRQQVNQICRRLEARGILLRRSGAHGKIVNVLSSLEGDRPSAEVKDSARRSRPTASQYGDIKTVACDPLRTLFVIPCSGSKRRGGIAELPGSRITDHLPQELGQHLLQARQEVAQQASVDERLLLPAIERYQGNFYGPEEKHTLREARERGIHVVIVSGGYGLVLPEEPIGYYKAVLRLSWWPPGLLESALVQYAKKNGLSHLRAFLAATTSYRKLVERVDWYAVGMTDAVLVTPIACGGGAQQKVPRAAGEAFCVALSGDLVEGWTSSDGLKVSVIPVRASPARPGALVGFQ